MPEAIVGAGVGRAGAAHAAHDGEVGAELSPQRRLLGAVGHEELRHGQSRSPWTPRSSAAARRSRRSTARTPARRSPAIETAAFMPALSPLLKLSEALTRPPTATKLPMKASCRPLRVAAVADVDDVELGGRQRQRRQHLGLQVVAGGGAPHQIVVVELGDARVGRRRGDQRHAAILDLGGDGEDLVAGVGADDDLGAEAIDDDVVGARGLRGVRRRCRRRRGRRCSGRR